MAKKQEPSQPRRTLNQSKSKTQNVSKKSTKNKNKAAKDDSSSTESQNDGVLESSEEDNGVEESEKAKSSKKKGKKEGLRKLGKKKNRKREEEDEAADDKIESVLYRFPMKRINRIIRSEISDVRISHEAVFLINRASEKFLELFCKEAYACALVDRKKHIAYDHMSAVVSKRRRFNFLRDFVPEKVKAEYALAQIPEADK